MQFVAVKRVSGTSYRSETRSRCFLGLGGGAARHRVRAPRGAGPRLRRAGSVGVRGVRLANRAAPAPDGHGGVLRTRGAAASQNIMLSIDLLNQFAWQRCWDRSCVVQVGGGYRKARFLVGPVPPAVLPQADVI